MAGDESTQTPKRRISLDFTLYVEDGEQVDSNVGKDDPMVFRSGMGEMMPALESEILVMQVGDTKRIKLKPEQAYGLNLEEYHRAYPLEEIPEEAREVGQFVEIKSPEGEVRLVEVIRIEDGQAYLNFNHPLAGRALVYDITVLSNEPLS